MLAMRSGGRDRTPFACEQQLCEGHLVELALLDGLLLLIPGTVSATHLVGTPGRHAGARPQERFRFTLHVHHLDDLEEAEETPVQGNKLHRD